MRSRVAIVAALALLLALLSFAGSALQFTLTVGEALAQSSVRPPDDAVNTEPLLRGETVAPDREQVLPGGSVRPPADTGIAVPTAPGVARSGELQPSPPAEPGQGPLGTRGANSDADLWGYLRRGGQASVTIPDKNAAVLVQDEGMQWLALAGQGRAAAGLGRLCHPRHARALRAVLPAARPRPHPWRALGRDDRALQGL